MVSPSEKARVQSKLSEWKVPHHEFMSDLGVAIQRTITESSQRFTLSEGNGTRSSDERFYGQFQSYKSIEARLSYIAKSSKRMTIETLGKSFEGRNIHLVKISKDPSARKPVILIDALHHAREWASLSTAMYLIESLANDGFSTRSSRRITRRRHHRTSRQHSHSHSQSHSQSHLRQSLHSVLDEYDFWIVPCVNPDGYEYTREADRMWRKTRSGSGRCRGADPNRNYPIHWNESGTSSKACSEIYAGTKPLSEVESQNMARLMDGNANRIKMYLSLHAFSQVILCPYGYAKVYPKNYENLKRVAMAGIKALASIRGTKYEFGTSAILMYPAAGGSDDYAHGIAGIEYSYTMELPDTGVHGFLLPPDQIVPVGEETIAAVAAMTHAIKTT